MGRWNPWAAARRHAGLTILYGHVPYGATWHRTPKGDVITIDESATRRERRALLAHELIHMERGVGFPYATLETMAKEEVLVRRETARRLVPLEELAEFVVRRASVEQVTPDVVAEEFDVPPKVASDALAQLPRRPTPLT